MTAKRALPFFFFDRARGEAPGHEVLSIGLLQACPSRIHSPSLVTGRVIRTTILSGGSCDRMLMRLSRGIVEFVRELQRKEWNHQHAAMLKQVIGMEEITVVGETYTETGPVPVITFQVGRQRFGIDLQELNAASLVTYSTGWYLDDLGIAPDNWEPDDAEFQGESGEGGGGGEDGKSGKKEPFDVTAVQNRWWDKLDLELEKIKVSDRFEQRDPGTLTSAIYLALAVHYPTSAAEAMDGLAGFVALCARGGANLDAYKELPVETSIYKQACGDSGVVHLPLIGFAVLSCCPGAVEVICMHGADVNAKVTDTRPLPKDFQGEFWSGWTPLMLAARHGLKDIVMILLSWGASCDTSANTRVGQLDAADMSIAYRSRHVDPEIAQSIEDEIFESAHARSLARRVGWKLVRDCVHASRRAVEVAVRLLIDGPEDAPTTRPATPLAGEEKEGEDGAKDEAALAVARAAADASHARQGEKPSDEDCRLLFEVLSTSRQLSTGILIFRPEVCTHLVELLTTFDQAAREQLRLLLPALRGEGPNAAAFSLHSIQQKVEATYTVAMPLIAPMRKALHGADPSPRGLSATLSLNGKRKQLGEATSGEASAEAVDKYRIVLAPHSQPVQSAFENMGFNLFIE